MKIFRALADVPAEFGPSVVTIGNFDGVHCGHQALLSAVVHQARQAGAAAVAVTFTPHPAQVIRPGEAPRLITPDAKKLELLAASGLDAVLVLKFDETLRRTAAQDFVRNVLRDALHAIAVHEGDNFHFGFGGQGNVSSLQHLGLQFGFHTIVPAPALFRGQAVSSSRVRASIAAGQMGLARHLLGRSFSILGAVAAGRGYGSRYTVPTINFAPYDGLLPKRGVYVTELAVHGESGAAQIFPAVTNVGNRPTFGPGPESVETHILDFTPFELHATMRLELFFFRWLRDEKKFSDAAALKTQIGRDVRRARRWFQLREALRGAVPRPRA